jgi:glycosyltransferase involved in cell wall biosynthesis
MRVAVVYHMFPHYRLPVIRALMRLPHHRFLFLGSGEPLDGVLHADVADVAPFEQAPFRQWYGVTWQMQAVSVALRRDVDALIYLGNPNHLSTWAGAAIARLLGKPVLLWTHGWLRHERGVKRVLRQLFYRLGNEVLVYADRAVRIGAESGYPPERIHTVYNSLDTDEAAKVIAAIEGGRLSESDPRPGFANPTRPLVVCTARLTHSCRFDLLFEAAAILQAKGRPLNILLVGEGPVAAALDALARRLNLTVRFFGPCYNEAVLGQLIYHADVTVSPGKIGLTAMHSLMYGTPAITHGDLDHQMPEVEAILPGLTGSLFRRGDADDLARVMSEWLDSKRDRAAVRTACLAEVAARWNPDAQAALIAQSLDRVSP